MPEAQKQLTRRLTLSTRHGQQAPCKYGDLCRARLSCQAGMPGAGACGYSCGVTPRAAPRRFAQALNATYGCVPSNADHCCLGLAPSSQLGQFGLLGLRPVYDACSQLPGCSYQARSCSSVARRCLPNRAVAQSQCPCLPASVWSSAEADGCAPLRRQAARCRTACPAAARLRMRWGLSLCICSQATDT